jgi:hypothetical protein
MEAARVPGMRYPDEHAPPGCTLPLLPLFDLVLPLSARLVWHPTGLNTLWFARCSLVSDSLSLDHKLKNRGPVHKAQLAPFLKGKIISQQPRISPYDIGVCRYRSTLS